MLRIASIALLCATVTFSIHSSTSWTYLKSVFDPRSFTSSSDNFKAFTAVLANYTRERKAFSLPFSGSTGYVTLSNFTVSRHPTNDMINRFFFPSKFCF